MPEGDTLHRIAATLGKALAGKQVRRWRSPLPGLSESRLEGSVIARIEAQGKNLLIHLDDGRVLHTHLRMRGSWHLYRPGERWQKPARHARAVIETEDFVAVCFHAPVVALLPPGGAARHPGLRSLGPDLLDEAVEATEARRRLRALGDRPLGDALMVQSAVAGIGNVYKSETLFLCQTSPFLPVRALDDAALDGILARARALMRDNLDRSPRATRTALSGPRHWVYGRGGAPCLRCGTTIEVRRQGTLGRTTYFCPTCQPFPAVA